MGSGKVLVYMYRLYNISGIIIEKVYEKQDIKLKTLSPLKQS